MRAAKASCRGPRVGKLIHRFGEPRSGGLLKWQGIVINAPEGAPVAAVHAGKVAFSDWLRGFGLLTIIDHGSGYMSLYAHSDVLYKQVGDQVTAGETIATAGRSGGQSHEWRVLRDSQQRRRRQSARVAVATLMSSREKRVASVLQ